MRVLVIEDDRALRDAIAFELRGVGYEVSTACDGAIGWSVLNDGSPFPDVILLDLSMPNLGGQHFRIRQLADPGLAGLPTLVLTATKIDAPMREVLGDVLAVPRRSVWATLLATVAEAGEPRGHVVKQCVCGLVYDSGSWLALPIVGEIDNGREVGERLELRNCTCESTLAWQVGVHAISIPS